MPNSVLSNWWGNQILQAYLVAHGAYVSLHTDDPTTAGDPATEMNVTRQHANFTSPGNKAIANTNSLVFTELIADSVSYLALWNQGVGGNMFLTWKLATPIATPESGHLLIAPGDLAIQL